MTALAVALFGIAAALIWAGFTDANLWQEFAAVFTGSRP